MYVFSKEKQHLQLWILSKIQNTSKLNLNLPFKTSGERNKQKQLQDTEYYRENAQTVTRQREDLK